MIDTYFGAILIAIGLITAAIAAYRFRGNRSAVSLCLLMLSAVGMTHSPDASALEIKRGETITIAEDEVVDDTLLIAGETIIIDGRVTGDLFTAGRRIVINGSVDGNLVAFSDVVSVEGDVGGFVLSAASNITLDGNRVGGDFWAAADQVTISDSASVASNATIASSLASIDGSVGRDVVTFSDTVNISGTVGQDLEAFAEKVNLMDDGHIKGNLLFRTKNEDRLQQSDDSMVDGTIEFVSLPADWEPRNKYASADFYIGQSIRFVAAFLAGLALLWLIPSLRYASLESGFEGVKTAGIGFIALIMLPVTMIVFAITVVGLPFSLVTLFTWGLLIYFAKIVVAAMIGAMALNSDDEDKYAVPLLVGLAIVIISVNIPGIGGAISFIMTIVGMGILTRYLIEFVQDARGLA